MWGLCGPLDYQKFQSYVDHMVHQMDGLDREKSGDKLLQLIQSTNICTQSSQGRI